MTFSPDSTLFNGIMRHLLKVEQIDHIKYFTTRNSSQIFDSQKWGDSNVLFNDLTDLSNIKYLGF